MLRIPLVKIYGWIRKEPGVPDVILHTRPPMAKYRDVPIYPISVKEMTKVIQLEEVDVIKNNHHEKVLILTDGDRILVVNHEGYDYARYKGKIDVQTAQAILQLLR